MVEVAAEPLEGPLAEVVRRLVDALRPERIYLFGSHARGDATEDSDYDLLVIVEERQDQPVRMEQQAYRALRGLLGGVDVVVMTRDFFERRRQVVASLPATVVREGRLLYGG